MNLSLKAIIGTSGRKLLLGRALAGCLLAAAATLAQSTDQPDLRIEKIAENTYLTYGFGPTEPEARVNAIRNGLQFATQQLVVSGIKIEADQIVQDTLYSTMNGYIEAFEVIDSGTTDGEVFVTARLEISDSQIMATVDRYAGIGLGIESTSKVDGSGIRATLQAANAERTRRSNQLYVASKLFDQMASDWPENAYKVSLINLSVDKEAPEIATLTLDIRYDEKWLETFYAHQKLIGGLVEWLPSKINAPRLYKSYNRINLETFYTKQLCWANYETRESHCSKIPYLTTSFNEGQDIRLQGGWVTKDQSLRTSNDEVEYRLVVDEEDLAYDDYKFAERKRQILQVCVFDENKQFINRVFLTSTAPTFMPWLAPQNTRKVDPYDRASHKPQPWRTIIDLTPATDRHQVAIGKLVDMQGERYPEFFQFSVGFSISNTCPDTLQKDDGA